MLHMEGIRTFLFRRVSAQLDEGRSSFEQEAQRIFWQQPVPLPWMVFLDPDEL
jgi:hypothetical protein